MITFEQLKEVLIQSEVEIQSFNESLSGEEYANVMTNFFTDVNDAKILHDLIRVYEDRGFETYDAYAYITNTLMATATLDQAVFRLYIYGIKIKNMNNEQHVDLGYIECMGEDFHIAVKEIAKAWVLWKNGPATEAEDIAPAKEEVMYFISEMLK